MGIKLPKKYLKMCEIYALFADKNCDLSEKAKTEFYQYETFGKGDFKIGGFNTTNNGFAVGKRWMHWTVTQWLDDCNIFNRGGDEKKHYFGWGNIIRDLYKDEFPHWWLDGVFKKFLRNKKEFYVSHGIKTPLEFNMMVNKLKNDD